MRPRKKLNLEEILNRAREIKQQNGFKTLPEINKLRKLGYNDLANALLEHPEGNYEIRQKLGENPPIPHGTWKDINYARKYALKLMQDLGITTLPSQKNLENSDINHSHQ